MARKSSIDRLDPVIRAAVLAAFGDGATIDDVTDLIREMGGEVSRSAVGRESKKFTELARQMRDQRTVAEAFGREFGESGSEQRMMTQLMTSVITRAILPIASGDDIDLSSKELSELATAVQRMSSAAKVDVDREIKVREEATGADFAGVCRYMDGAIAKIILSQTMTTDSGSSHAQGRVHAEVKLEVVKADADLLSDSFANGPARWWTDLNFGPDVAAPRVVRVVEEPDDLKEAADTDAVLAAIGWRRSEDSFRERYGDGYEYSPPPAPPQVKPDPSASVGGDDGGEPGGDNVVKLRAPAGFAEAAVLGAPEAPHDVVDDAVDAAMADDGWRSTLGVMVQPLVEQLRAATSPDDVAAILSREAELADDGALTEALTRAAFATRMDALTSDAEDGA